MHELNFHITNLNCDACVKMTTSTLRRLSSRVTEVSVDLDTGSARLVSEVQISPDDVVSALAAKGYRAAF